MRNGCTCFIALPQISLKLHVFQAPRTLGIYHTTPVQLPARLLIPHSARHFYCPTCQGARGSPSLDCPPLQRRLNTYLQQQHRPQRAPFNPVLYHTYHIIHVSNEFSDPCLLRNSFEVNQSIPLPALTDPAFFNSFCFPGYDTPPIGGGLWLDVS